MKRLLLFTSLSLLFMVSDARSIDGDLITIRMDMHGHVYVDNAMHVRDAQEADTIKGKLFKAVHEAVTVRP